MTEVLDKPLKCKVCRSLSVTEIDAMILNGADYPTIIKRHAQLQPNEKPLNKSNITTHKRLHLLTKPIVKIVETEDGTVEQRTYLTGHYPAPTPVITKENIPDLPPLADCLKVIIGAGVHNILNNPDIVTPNITIRAMELFKVLFGKGDDELNSLLGNWDGVADAKEKAHRKAKKTRTVSVTETVEEETTINPADEPNWGEAIEGEWAVLPAPTPEEN